MCACHTLCDRASLTTTLHCAINVTSVDVQYKRNPNLTRAHCLRTRLSSKLVKGNLLVLLWAVSRNCTSLLPQVMDAAAAAAIVIWMLPGLATMGELVPMFMNAAGTPQSLTSIRGLPLNWGSCHTWFPSTQPSTTVDDNTSGVA